MSTSEQEDRLKAQKAQDEREIFKLQSKIMGTSRRINKPDKEQSISELMETLLRGGVT